MLTFIVDDKLFKTEPLFVVGCSHAELHRYLMSRWRVSAGDDVGQAGQMFTLQRAPWRVVWVKKHPRTIKQFTCLLHEIFHLVTRICQDKGVPIVAQIAEHGNGDETAAYLFDFFSREAMKRLRIKVH